MISGLSSSIHETARRAGQRACLTGRSSLPWRLSLIPVLQACALLAGLTAQPAMADLKLCNSSASRIGVAIGYQDGDGWTTEGWWNIASQTCETLLKGTLSSRFYYVHAVDYDRGGEWAGTNLMCTSDRSFTIRGNRDCAKRSHSQSGFFEVDTNQAKDWTIRLTDPGDTAAKPK
jgi:uncharacterized membrane protein